MVYTVFSLSPKSYAFHLFIPPHPWQPLISLMSIVLPFPKCHIVGIIQPYTDITVLDWSISLNNYTFMVPTDLFMS